jgi:hypothetical protein
MTLEKLGNGKQEWKQYMCQFGSSPKEIQYSNENKVIF